MKFHLVFISLLVLAYGSDIRNPKFPNDELYSSSILGYLKLFELEKQFMTHVKGYGDALQEKLDTLKLHLKTIDRKAHKTQAGRDKYISNPLKAFSLLRRLREDWIRLQVYTKAKPGKGELDAMKKLLDRKQNFEDLQEGLRGLSRIEQTYDLNAVDISQGRLLNQEFNKELSLRDCLAIANHKYQSGDYTRAAVWYRQAIKHKDEPNSEVYNEALGKPAAGLRRKYAMACLMHATHIRYPSLNHKELQAEVDKILREKSSIDLEKFVRQLLEQDVNEFIQEAEQVKPPTTDHDLGCRGLFKKRTNLSCRYNFTTTPFLRLAPLKMEEINHDPYIVMYHNMISDREIEEMKRLSVNMSNGFSGVTSQNQTESIEVVARVAWLVEKTPFLERINQRITDMTGLDVNEFRAVQIANYGLGNYFKPHYDYMYGNRIQMNSIDGLGDRMGSLIFYTGDVPQGGMTVFPNIQVAVEPQKGNSLFWYNIFDDGTPDPRTLHSVCPVIVGDRWTITKWLHMASQIFTKPCSPKKKLYYKA
ncbi:prolyl 4-hydroxylase subunit alpha-1 [Drosophila innubila]|uniref:prolyl 4-hydroxylase subunit alpha-1 n=1 Tax=Drosophila innubila TaxID=198719 RepID=UPI00148D027E|nr:prolyl 4-hydroxylase subunit alpha-1 [Drosophila innubila]